MGRREGWEKRPFASLDEMHAEMVAVAKYAPAAMQRPLKSHPDLAGKEAEAGTTTRHRSPNRQRRAQCPVSCRDGADVEFNAAYKKKFGFPFIIAVRMHTKEGILFEFNRRLQNDTQTEFANDLQNVYIITRLRLNKLLNAS